MIKNYLKHTIRNLYTQKQNSIINILGLSVGICLFILIMTYVSNELTVDNFHKNKDNIYRIEVEGFSSACAAGVPAILKDQFPEIKETARYFQIPSSIFQVVNNNDISFKQGLTFENLIVADSTFFDIFTYEVTQGNLHEALTNPNSIVLTSSSAKKLFGNEDPIGKVINIKSMFNFTVKVTAIINDVPNNSTINFNGIVSLITVKNTFGDDFLNNLSNWFYATYFLLHSNQNIDELEQKTSSYFTTEINDNDSINFVFRPLNEIYFHKDELSGNYSSHGNIQFVYAFIAIAIIIILLAIINFINLSTATASCRAKEVGLRKVVGSTRKKLIIQFLGETITVSLISVFIAIILAEIFKYEFNNIVGKELSLGYIDNPIIILYLVIGAILIGILAGLYPAFYLSSFQPTYIFNKLGTKGSKGIFLRKFLIIFQFIISIVLIISSFTINQQIELLKNKDLGFNNEQIVYLDLNRELTQNTETFKNELKQNTAINNITISNFVPGQMDGNMYVRTINETNYHFYYIMTDPFFFDVMNLSILEGRGFSDTKKDEMGWGIVLNQAAVKEFNLENPIGTEIYVFDTVGQVIGVVEDFNFRSLHHKIEPMSILYIPEWSRVLQINISADNISQTLDYIEKTWVEFCPGYPFDYHFMDEGFDKLYKAEEKFGIMFKYFSLLAIFIACLGLYGLISYTSLQRTQEVCIRKVQGASIKSIILLLSKDLSIWLSVSFIFACPIAYIIMGKWLQNFAYRTNQLVIIYILAGIITSLIAFSTVLYKSYKTASSNPIIGLRYE
jgi:putative ABC transport system permease protein